MRVARRSARISGMILSAVALVLLSVASFGEDSSEYVDSAEGRVANSVIDIDGSIYTTVVIGTQVWMAENLKVTHYRNGRAIPNITENTAWGALVTGAFSWYDNDLTHKDTFGALYNFYAVADTCGLCPEGWHVPTESEWLALEDYLGGGSVAGGKAKEAGTAHWSHPNVGATGESGFQGLPGGGRGQELGFGEIGNYATWWSSTAYDSLYAWHWGLYHGNAKVRSNPGHMASGFSVRCIRDQ